MSITYKIDLNEPTADDMLQERVFQKKDIPGVSYAMLNYWNKEGFLLDTHKSGAWRKFNYYELAWVYMLNELRELNIELKTIIEPLKAAFTGKSFEEMEGVEVTTYEIPEETREKLRTWEIAPIDPAYSVGFQFYVWFAVENKSLLTVRIYSGSKVEILTSDSFDQEQYTLQMTDYSRSFISLSLSGILAKMLGDKDIPTLQSLNILSDNELTLLKFLRNNDLQNVSIKYLKGEPVSLELKTWTDMTDQNKRILEIFQSPYEEITFKTNGGKTYGFVRTQKIKLKE